MSETKHYAADEVGQLMQDAAKEISRVTDINVALLAACKAAIKEIDFLRGYKETSSVIRQEIENAIFKAEGRDA